jgi:hypothetical protein
MKEWIFSGYGICRVAEKGDDMATTDVCNDIPHAKHDEAVNFTNSSGMKCQLNKGSTEWPFTDGHPFDVPVGGRQTKVKPKADLKDGTYQWIPDCCPDAVPKTVTVP